VTILEGQNIPAVGTQYQRYFCEVVLKGSKRTTPAVKTPNWGSSMQFELKPIHDFMEISLGVKKDHLFYRRIIGSGKVFFNDCNIIKGGMAIDMWCELDSLIPRVNGVLEPNPRIHLRLKSE